MMSATHRSRPGHLCPLHPDRCRRPNGQRRLPPRNPSPASLVPAVHKYPINTPYQTFYDQPILPRPQPGCAPRRITGIQETSHIQPRRSSYVNGSSVATPSRSKSRTLRVSTVSRCTTATAAIMASCNRVSDLRCISPGPLPKRRRIHRQHLIRVQHSYHPLVQFCRFRDVLLSRYLDVGLNFSDGHSVQVGPSSATSSIQVSAAGCGRGRRSSDTTLVSSSYTALLEAGSRPPVVLRPRRGQLLRARLRSPQ